MSRLVKNEAVLEKKSSPHLLLSHTAFTVKFMMFLKLCSA